MEIWAIINAENVLQGVGLTVMDAIYQSRSSMVGDANHDDLLLEYFCRKLIDNKWDLKRVKFTEANFIN